MIVPISTPSAQAVVGATKEIPVVFTAVTDPVGAKLVRDLEHPGGNVTGMSDLSPIGKHLDLIKEIMPAVKTLGVIYNPGEANSLTLLELLQGGGAGARASTIQEAPAPKSSDVLPAAQSLVGNVEAIYVPTDNTVVTALEAIVQVGQQNQLPVYRGRYRFGAARGDRGTRLQLWRRRPADRQDRRARAQGREAGRHRRSRGSRSPSCSSIPGRRQAMGVTTAGGGGGARQDGGEVARAAPA